MRNLFVLPAIAGLVFVIGCVEKPIEETGSSTATAPIQDQPVDCCVQPEQDEPKELPVTDGTESEPQADDPEPQADGAEPQSDTAEPEGTSEEN